MKIAALLFLISTTLSQAAELKRPPIVGIAHIAFFAHHYSASRSFYHDFLGFDEPYSLKNADGSPSMTFFKINDRQYIELSPEKSSGSDRLNHYAIETTDAEAMRQYLAARGVAVPDSVPKGKIGNLNFMIKDPEGHSVEIVQYPADSWTFREKGNFMPDARISKRLMHVGIIVTKFDEEMKFYQDVLGFEETWRGSSTGKVLSWINLKVPNGEDYVEFMLSKDEPDAARRGTAHHLCLEVPDITDSLAKLSGKPYRTQYTRQLEPRTGVNRKRQLNLFDPDGTRTELMELRTVDGLPAKSSSAFPPGKSGQ